MHSLFNLFGIKYVILGTSKRNTVRSNRCYIHHTLTISIFKQNFDFLRNCWETWNHPLLWLLSAKRSFFCLPIVYPIVNWPPGRNFLQKSEPKVCKNNIPPPEKKWRNRLNELTVVLKTVHLFKLTVKIIQYLFVLLIQSI